MREGRLGYNSYNKDMDYYHQIYGLIQDFTVENAWKCCLMMNGFRPEWK